MARNFNRSFRLFPCGLESVLVAVILLLVSQYAVAKVTAKVDRQYAYEGETVTLSVKAENSQNAQPPDFSVLAGNFDIGGTSQSSSISIINGRSSSSKTWSVRLHPKKIGEIEIPALSVGQETTLPFKIEIKPIPVQSGKSKGQSVFLTLEVDGDATKFYVQQHIPLVARLYYKHTINQGQMSDPAPDNALVERLGDDANYKAKHDDQEYKVFERRYSMFAEKSGRLLVPSISFQGKMTSTGNRQNTQRRHDPFAQFFNNTPLLTQGQPVSIRSEPLELTIEPHPTSFNGQQWLPAESLTLHDSWTDNPPSFKVGEPVSRTITLEAKGLVASQLKPLELPAISSFRRYAEPAEASTRTDGQNVYASSRRTFTYIPAYDGEQEIPALELNWWNVVAQKQETAHLAPWKVIVEKGLDTTQTAPLTPAPAQSSQSAGTSSSATESSNLRQTDSNDYFEQFKTLFARYGFWAVGLIILAYAAIVLFANRKREQSQQEIPVTAVPATAATITPSTIASASVRTTTKSVNTKQLLDNFRQACQQNKAADAARALLEIARLTWPDNPPRSIGALADYVETGREELRDLDRYLYSGSKEGWNGQSICTIFNNGFEKKPEQQHTETALHPLYPEQE